MSTTPVNDRYEYVPGMSLLAEDQYRRDTAWIRLDPLSEEEEKRLFAQLVRAHCEPCNQWRARIAMQARDRLVEAYQPVVFNVARKVLRQLPHLELLDVVSEANLGLLQALDVYVVHCSKGSDERFIGLAITQMHWAIWKARYMHGPVCSLPKNQASLLSCLHRASSRFESLHGFEPSVSDLAVLLHLSEEEVLDLQDIARYRHAASLQGLLDEEKDVFGSLALAPVFPPAQETTDALEGSLKAVLHEIIENDVTPRQREVIKRIYGFDDEVGSGASPSIVAESLGMDVRHLSQYERHAVNRLRRLLAPLLDEDGNLQASREEWYSTKQVAALLGLSCTTVQSRVKAGVLPVNRFPTAKGDRTERWRFSKDMIDALVSLKEEEEKAA